MITTVLSQNSLIACIAANNKPNQGLHHNNCPPRATNANELTKGFNSTAVTAYIVELCHVNRVEEPYDTDQWLDVKHICHTGQLRHTTSHSSRQRHPQRSVTFRYLQQMNATHIYCNTSNKRWTATAIPSSSTLPSQFSPSSQLTKACLHLSTRALKRALTSAKAEQDPNALFCKAYWRGLPSILGLRVLFFFQTD